MDLLVFVFVIVRLEIGIHIYNGIGASASSAAKTIIWLATDVPISAMEVLSAALALSHHQELRAKVFNCLKRYFFGDKGILRFLEVAPWWPMQNIWNNSKSAGNPILLCDFLEYGEEFGATAEELARCETLLDQIGKFLCAPKFSVQIGVMTEDSRAGLPCRTHSIQSWTGCAVAATGFAGLSFAKMIRSGIIYPKN